MELKEILKYAPRNLLVVDSLTKAYHTINNSSYKKIMCSVSGGADSDIVIDICTKCDNDKKIDYVWFDTGLEYEATKRHLKYLEERYEIEIRTEKAIKPIPVSCKQYGQPFISKNVSEMIYRLQKHNFKWEDKPFDKLYKEYPNCKGALQWWCNTKHREKDSRFCIARNKLLKEFIIENPPTIKVSPICCKYAKKDVAKKIIKENHYDLDITGIRKAEGGQRATAYKNCFDAKIGECDNYRPLFWYLNDTKKAYEDHYNIVHSDCYSVYRFKRTGCACCPFAGRELEMELEALEKHEPKLYVAVNNVFGESYEYTRKYREFVKSNSNVN